MTLKDFFETHKKVAVAFSGGTDSAYLLYAARQYGADVRAYYVSSQFQPAFALEDAKRLTEELMIPLTIIPLDVLSRHEIVANPSNRCAFCKKAIMEALFQAIQADGYSVLLDGNNASDDPGDRPGMQVAHEMGVISPLSLCGITKAEIRDRSREAGLFTWNIPAYACLATRIPSGTKITADDLKRVEEGETILHEMGFRDVRLRIRGSLALLQLTENDYMMGVSKRKELLEKLSPIFETIALDLNVR